MKTLIAGFGNIFLSDDGFGPALIRSLDPDDFANDTVVRDFGTAGMHLALEMSAGYELVIIVDALRRNAPAGTVFAIEANEAANGLDNVADAHAMSVPAVLELFERIARQLSANTARPRIILCGCVPHSIEEGMDLSEPVRAAIPLCADLIGRLTEQLSATGASS